MEGSEIELNGTQSNSIRGWVRLSLVIEPNRTPNYVWVRFSNQLNSIKQIKPVSLLDCVWLCKPAEFNQTESNGLGRIVRWINLLEQRLGSVVLKARKTHVILKSLEPSRKFYWFSTSVLPKSRVWKSNIQLFDLVCVQYEVLTGLIAKCGQTQSLDWASLSLIEFNFGAFDLLCWGCHKCSTYLMTKGYGVFRADSPAWRVTANADWSLSWWSWKFSLLNCMTSWPHLSKSNNSCSKSTKGYLYALHNIDIYFLLSLLR